MTMQEIWEVVKSFGVSFFTVVFFILIFIGVKFILKRQSRGKSDFKMIHQIILFLLAFVGVVAFILTLPMNDDLRGQVTSLMGIVISAVFALSSATSASSSALRCAN